MKPFLLFVVALLALSSTSVRAQSAPPRPVIFATITGQKSGAIRGEVIQKGREQQHTILDFEYSVVSPRDSVSGNPAGKRQHRLVRLLKKVTAASPLLFNSMVSNETLSSVRIDFWEPSRVGSEVQTQTITLQNASLASWRQFFHPELGLVEELELSFQKITIEWRQGGITAQDDWTQGKF